MKNSQKLSLFRKGNVTQGLSDVNFVPGSTDFNDLAFERISAYEDATLIARDGGPNNPLKSCQPTPTSGPGTFASQPTGNSGGQLGGHFYSYEYDWTNRRGKLRFGGVDRIY